MKILQELQSRFRPILGRLADDPEPLLAMIRPAQDKRFGDYQANCAMPLAKRLGKPPRDVAAEIVAAIDVADMCQPPEVAGPGFINLRLRDDWLERQINEASRDERLGVRPVETARRYVVDFSSPNVAKPMHVGHLRSTVIGDALCRTLRFLGHEVISDNHLGDWGTQFGMIIYGYKHFADARRYQENPVTELARLYQLVRRLMDYHAQCRLEPELERRVNEQREELAALKQASPPDKKALRRCKKQLAEREEKLAACRTVRAEVEGDARLRELAERHRDIEQHVLEETARLHSGDEENRRLWEEFLPHCRKELDRLYGRLDISFDYHLGESFYHDQLAAVVDEFLERGLARESNGAVAVFLEGYEAPLLIRKQDGAFLYATTDLATIRYRMQQWQPDAILYVVDFRQSEHFGKLFAAARQWGYDDVELQHVSFGTVLGEDGRPFRTRAGDTVGLESLLDEAIERARRVVSRNDDEQPGGPQLSDAQRDEIAETVGIAALKYADLSQNRTSDYVFSYDKMLQLNGNTATYMQYSYARVQGIFLRGDVDPESLRNSSARIVISHPDERDLLLGLLAFAETLDDVIADYRPNLLTNYLFELTKTFFTFYEKCPVLKAESEEVRQSRLLLCDFTARIIRQGLQLLGIRVVDRM